MHGEALGPIVGEPPSSPTPPQPSQLDPSRLARQPPRNMGRFDALNGLEDGPTLEETIASLKQQISALEGPSAKLQAGSTHGPNTRRGKGKLPGTSLVQTPRPATKGKSTMAGAHVRQRNLAPGIQIASSTSTAQLVQPSTSSA